MSQPSKKLELNQSSKKRKKNFDKFYEDIGATYDTQGQIIKGE